MHRDTAAPGMGAAIEPVAAKIIYFATAEAVGDVDNIVKPILDALADIVYVDDGQVESVTVCKVEPEVIWLFSSESETLVTALGMEAPVVYVRIDADLGWRTVA